MLLLLLASAAARQQLHGAEGPRAAPPTAPLTSYNSALG